MDSGSGQSRKAITLYSFEVALFGLSAVLLNSVFVSGRSGGAGVFNLLASSVFTVTLFPPSTWYQQVASGWVTLTGSADGALFSNESRAAAWREKWLPPKEGSR